MSVRNFLDFNSHCPICENKLTLYLQIRDSSLFQAEKVGNNYHFTQYLKKDKSIADDDKIILSEYDNVYSITTSKNIRSVLNFDQSILGTNSNMFFLFYLCNSQGFVKEYDDYYIGLYQGCYHRTSYDFVLQDNQVVPHHETNKVNVNESFSIVHNTQDNEKVFALSLNYIDDTTDFYFYSITEDQRRIPNFEPNIFEKHMPLLPNRPNFSHEGKEKLIQKMESWIMMS